MIRAPGSLPTPTPAFLLMEDFRGGALGGSLMFNALSCSLYPDAARSCRGLEKGGTVLTGLNRFTHNVCQVYYSRGGFAEVCMILWETNPPVWTVLYRMSGAAASTQAPCWNGRVWRKRGALGNESKLTEILLVASLRDTCHFQTAEVYLLVHIWIHFWQCPVCLCRAERVKLMELKSLRELQKEQTGCEVPRVTRKSCLVLLG